ncbi:MAG: LuxR C-terminal-related transcriptional regulator [Dehalococcoidia bacterium]
MQNLRADALSERKRQILHGIAAGKSNGVLADELGITVDGVKWHVSELLWDTGCADRHALADWWRRERGRSAAPAPLALRWPSGAAVASAGRVAFILALTAVLVLGVYAGWTCGSRATRTATTIVAPASTLGKIAYVQGGDIWFKALPDGTPQRLTHDGKSHAPRWSPSGRWLAFLSRKQSGVMRADGTGARYYDTAATTWAPVADRIAYTTNTGELVVENADGSGRKVIATWHRASGQGGGLSDATWSLDGAQIAYVEHRAAAGTPPQRTYEGIWRAPADGSAPPAEVYNTGDPPRDGLGIIAWSRGGALGAIVFYRAPSFTADLADGVTVEEIRPGGQTQPSPFYPANPVMLRDHALWSVMPSSGNIAITDGRGRETWGHKRIAQVSAVSGTVVVLTAADVAASQPAWSPGAHQIAYAAAPDAGTKISGGEPAKAAMAQRKIWVMRRRNTQDAFFADKRQLTSDPAYRDEYPQWSADGTQILFARLDAHGDWSLWLVPSAGGSPREVVSRIDANMVGTPAWFGFYGLISWRNVLDWFRPPAR